MLANNSSKKRSIQCSRNDDDELPTPLFLRVQRRGAITAASTLRVELDAATAAASALADVDLGESCATSAPLFNSSATALFRLVVEPNDDYNYLPQQQPLQGKDKSSGKRRRILDAVLLEDGDDDEAQQQQQNSHKRHKLTLQLLEPKKGEPQQPQLRIVQYPVLNPEQRAVDDSLQRIFQGEQSLRQHCEFLHTTPFSAGSYNNNNNSEQRQLWSSWPWLWCHAESGNWLHAAAIWNESQVVAQELNRFQQRFAEHHQPTTLLTIISRMLQAVDGEGRTPIDVAQLSGHEDVRQVLESFAQSAQEEQSNNIYDLYCLVPDTDRHSGGEHKDEENFVLDCELHNRCMGYWDDRGELVLEPPATAGLNNDDNASENGEGEDSNDEDWQGNDYPDDDDDTEGDAWSRSSNASYGCQLDNDFRRRPANNIYGSDDDNDAYDPAYGGIYGQGELD